MLRKQLPGVLGTFLKSPTAAVAGCRHHFALALIEAFAIETSFKK
jgi:hypothetical protein